MTDPMEDAKQRATEAGKSLVEGGRSLFDKIRAIAEDRTDSGEKEMIVVSFPDIERADAVLATLQEMEQSQAIDLGKAAVIRCDSEGQITVRETADVDAKEAAIVGGLAGSLLGMLGGKGLLGGMAGAGGSAAASQKVDLGLDDNYLAEVGGQLSPNSSAVVATLELTNTDAAMATLDQFDGGTIMHTTLPADAAAQLSAAVED